MKNFIDSKTYQPGIAEAEVFKHAEPESDDCGLPESPIYSNYVKYLWKAHTRQGGVQSLKGSRQITGGKQKASIVPI